MNPKFVTSPVRTLAGAAVCVWLAASASEAGVIMGNVPVAGAAEAERTVVYIEKAPHGSGATSHAKLSQKGARFSPAVLPVVSGTSVDMTNNDWVAHSVFSKSEVKPFDLGIYSPGSVRVVPFEEQGAIEVFCSIHPMMSSVVLVLQNPFFAKPNAQGQFEIEGVPAGSYTLKVFRLGGEPATKQVSVPAAGAVTATF
jgi:plastocyanin